MKRTFYLILSACLAFIMCISMIACSLTPIPPENDPTNAPADAPTDAPTDTPTNLPTNTPTTEAPTNAPTEDTRPDYVKDPDLDKFNLEKYMYPMWRNGTNEVSFAEASFVRENKDGVVEPLVMLYEISEIISVRSSDLKTLYQEGVDYRVTEDGCLEILEGSSIPVLPYDQYYYPNYIQAKNSGISVMPASDNSGGGYIYAEINNGSGGMSKWTIAVTYTHSGRGSYISEPDYKGDKFAPLLEKINNKEDIKVVSLGDSITDRWSASGTAANRAPYCPAYNIMLCNYIKKAYNVNVTHKNLAISGSNSATGGVHLINDAIKENPDLVIIAFGMNDGCGINPDTYISNINKIINDISAKSPDTCFIVMGTCLPNAKIGYNAGSSILVYHEKYIDYLIEAEESWEHGAFANVTTAHSEMMEVKAYEDTTGSNSNHPNDYIHRLYAQVAAQTIFGEIFGIR